MGSERAAMAGMDQPPSAAIDLKKTYGQKTAFRSAAMRDN
jgi:hypothetical protein